MGKRQIKAWCDQCRDHTWHNEVKVNDLIVDGQTVKDAYTLRCENWHKHSRRKAA